MDRNGIALNTLMFIRMSSNIFYPFSTIYPGLCFHPLCGEPGNGDVAMCVSLGFGYLDFKPKIPHNEKARSAREWGVSRALFFSGVRTISPPLSDSWLCPCFSLPTSRCLSPL